MDLALNDLQRLICHKTQQSKPNQYSAYLKAEHSLNLAQGYKYKVSSEYQTHYTVAIDHWDKPVNYDEVL